MKLEQLKTKYRDLILEIARQRNIENIRIFGSTARGEDIETSDINLKPNADLLDLSGLHYGFETIPNKLPELKSTL